METWVIWRDKNNEVNKVKFENYYEAKVFYEGIEVKDFKVKEISRDEYGVACGLYKLPFNKQWLLAV